MSKLRVGVLRGGPSSEYEVSLKTGASVLKNLSRQQFEPKDIFISRDGLWHLGGVPIWPEQAAEQVDIFFNALHGEYGEDGQVQRLLTNLERPFTGPEEISALASINKPLAKSLLAKAGIKVAPTFTLVARANNREAAKQVFNKLPPPWVVKPADRGSSFGLSLAKSFDELVAAIAGAGAYSQQILIEPYLPGREATVGVIDNFRGQGVYPLMPVEIRRPNNSPLWHHQHRYSGETTHLCPASFDTKDKSQLEALAVLAHETLGLRHYSRSDFIVSPRGIYLLEVDALPSLTEHCALPQALQASGANTADFLTHIINQALK